MKTTLKQIHDFYKAYPQYKGKINVETRKGYYSVVDAAITQANSYYYTIQTNNKIIKGSKDHLLFANGWKKIKDLKIGDFINTKDGYEQIKSIVKSKEKVDLYDIEVDTVKEYYANKIVSHNSTLTTVPFFALYGNTPKRANKPMHKDRIINKHAGKDLMAALQFSIGNQDYLVERYRKHHENKNGLFLYEHVGGSWHDLTRSDIGSTQQAINELVLINEETFLKTVLLSREDLQQFLDYSPIERWKIFESIIQLDKLKRYQDIVQRKKKQCQYEYNKATSDIVAVQALINHISTEMDELVTNAKDKKKALTDEIRELKSQAKTLAGKDIDSYMAEFAAAKQLSQAIANLRNDIIAAKDTITITESKLTSQITFSHACNDEILDTEKELKELEPITCHNCGVVQNEENYNKQKAQMQKHIDTQQQRKILNDAAILATREELRAYGDDIAVAQAMLDDMMIQWKAVKLSKTEKANIWENPLIETADLKGTHDIILAKQTEIDNIDNLNAPHLDRMKTNTTIKKAELKSLIKERTALKRKLDELEYLDSVLNIKNENSIKQYAVSTIMPVFNELMRSNLDQVFDDQLTLALDLLFNETIIFNGQQYSYHELSTGEKVKVNLSINMAIFDAMRLNVMNCGVMFMDEIFTNIDYPSIAAFTNMIRSKYAEDSAVYVITHQSEAIDILQPETVTTVIKENSSSRIETKMGA